jgi:2-polyprenyl-3-methyl-5-hydroxy-6-metoxy-1,4-benzoquinol methylase
MSNLFPDLGARSREPEVMDSLDLEESSHKTALRGLARINSLSFTAKRIWKVIRSLTAGKEAALRVLDVACGGGDVALSLKRRAIREGVKLHVEGCDLHPGAIEYATQRAREAGLDIGFFEHDATTRAIPAGFDLVCSSLFLHHLSNREAAAFLRRLDASGKTIFVQDLLRSRLGYLMALAATKAVTRSPVVHVDGPRSVRAAFSLGEIRELVRGAGLEGAKIERCWPQRFSIIWEGS